MQINDPLADDDRPVPMKLRIVEVVDCVAGNAPYANGRPISMLTLAHGMWFEHECLCNGVEVYFAGAGEANGPYRNLIQVAKYDAAHDVSVKIRQRSSQGRKHAQKLG